MPQDEDGRGDGEVALVAVVKGDAHGLIGQLAAAVDEVDHLLYAHGGVPSLGDGADLTLEVFRGDYRAAVADRVEMVIHNDRHAAHVGVLFLPRAAAEHEQRAQQQER